MPILSRPATCNSPASSWPRLQQWVDRLPERIRPLAIAFGFFALAFTATIVLRLVILLASLADRPGL